MQAPMIPNPMLRNYQQITTPQPPKEDLGDLCLNATFSAEEVLTHLKEVLEVNLSTKKTRQQIVMHVTSSLFKNAWEIKREKILLRLKEFNENKVVDQKAELDSIMEELTDMIAYIQILGGLNPEAAATYGINYHFSYAFSLLYQLIRVTQQWPESPILRPKQTEFLGTCYINAAQMLNINCRHFESPEALNKYLAMMLDLDSKGNMAEYFIQPLRMYYYRFVIATFRAKLTSIHLMPAIRAAHRLNIDITDIIEKVPDDPRKYMILSCQSCVGLYKDLAIKCALNCDDPDVVVKAMTLDRSNKEIQNHYFVILSRHLSNWINCMLKSAIFPYKDPETKLAHLKVQILTKPLNTNDKSSIFNLIRDTELEPALRSMIQKFCLDLNADDPMAKDLLLLMTGHKGK